MINIKKEVVEEVDLGQRVRLFKLSEDGDTWHDGGIGEISVYYAEDSNETYLLVHGEADGSLLLENKLQQNTVYEKQQERFIVWTELDDRVFGLSFQLNDGCKYIWEVICQVQGRNPYEEIPLETHIKHENIKKEEIETVIKQEVKDEIEEVKVECPNDLARELWFEEMLDLEHLVLSRYERDVLGQLIEIVNGMVSPTLEDIVPSPAERKLLDLFQINDDIEETKGLEQLHKTVLYFLSTRNAIPKYITTTIFT